MRLPKEKIVFVVDTIPVGAFPGRGFIDIYPLETEDFIKKVIAMDWERMIPGHPGPGDRLGTKKDAQDVLTLMQEASAAIKTRRPGRQVLGRGREGLQDAENTPPCPAMPGRARHGGAALLRAVGPRHLSGSAA